MPLSQTSIYNAKVTPVIQKKRRKSDLVILWCSIYNVTLHILFKIHLSITEIWRHLKFWFWHDEIYEIQSFLKQYLPRVPDDFSNSWRDGKLLCVLLNKLKPGCIPEAEHLDPNYGLRNMYQAFDVLESKFGIIPTTSVEKLVVCIDGSDIDLLDIIFKLKKETENKHEIPQIIVESDEITNNPECNTEPESCVIKGTGLVVAFAGRKATFNISCSPSSDVNIVIEIKGPSNTICRERITKRSPKKKLSTSNLEQYTRQSLFRTNSLTEKRCSRYETDKLDDNKNKIIPLEYNIYLNQINVTYIPLVEGEHKISVLWYGHHVSDSPYVVSVESAPDVYNIHAPNKQSYVSNLPRKNKDCTNKELAGTTRKSQESNDKMERIGKVISRRVLRHIVKINGKDVVVDSNDIDHLAAALLKMDYDFQTDPSKTRRNSWGFDGDAERKTSVIRQFCVPPHEMEAQYMKLQRRSQSFSLNSDSTPLLKRCSSFETEDVAPSKRLETVSETSDVTLVSKCHEEKVDNEELYAYINEDFTFEEDIKEDQGVICNSESVESLEDKQVTESSNTALNSFDKKLLHPLLVNDMKDTNNTPLAVREQTLPPYDLIRSSDSVRQSDNSISVVNDDRFQKREQEEMKRSEAGKKLDIFPSKPEQTEKTQTNLDQTERTINTVQDLRRLYCVNTFEGAELFFGESLEKQSNTLNFLNEQKSDSFIPGLATKNYSITHQLESNYSKNCLSKEEHIPTNKYSNLANTETCENYSQNKFENADQLQSSKVQANEQSTKFSNNIEILDVKQRNCGKDICLRTLPTNCIINTVASQELKNKATPNISQISDTENFCNVSDFIMKSELSLSTSPSLSFNLSELDFKEDSHNVNIQNLNLTSLGQYNFKQFNPSLENRGSLISHKIKKLKESVMRNPAEKITKVFLKNEDKIGNVNLRDKLTFWENVYQRNQKENLEKKIDDVRKFIAEMNNLHKESPVKETLIKEQISKCPDSKLREVKNEFSSTPSDSDEVADSSSNTQNKDSSKHEKLIENKLSSEISSTPKSKRSFSDPGILGYVSRETSAVNPKISFCEPNQTSSTDNLSTSIDVESSFEDDGLSSTDPLISTEDEYIDDEIPEDSLFTYWGDLSLLKSMKTANLSRYKEYCQYIDSEILKNQYQCAKSCPSECKVFGIGAYFGYVAVKNQFQVLTKDAGNGNLSVSVQGFGKHDVGFVSVKYKNKDIYEVTYQVMRPGLYLISLRWMENPIVGSPFLCKITF